MSYKTPQSRRTLVPRWRASSEAANAGELRSATKTAVSNILPARSPHFDILKSEFSGTQSVEVAADLISTGVAIGSHEDPAVHRAAEFILKESPTFELKALATRILANQIGRLNATVPIPFDFDKARAALQSQIAANKIRLRAYPRNAIAWADIGRLYAALGQRTKAKDAIQVATTLAGNNRFILRSAARFFVHGSGDALKAHLDEGLRLLRRSRILREDPWIMAAEISLSSLAHEDPRILARAKDFVEADSFHPWDLSELNGSLATLAISEGGVGKPSKLFGRSLRRPTENALAQAQWASVTHNAINITAQNFSSTPSPPHEALALKFRASSKWQDAISACREWSAMEPTSTRPLLLGSFIAEVALENGEIAREFSERARLLDPSSLVPANNLAVALAYLGRLDEAEQLATACEPKQLPEEMLATYWATLGLIAYRRGDRERGLDLYLKAASTSRAEKTPRDRALVLWHLLREEARIGAPGIAPLADKLWEKTSSAEVPEISALRDRLVHPSLVKRIVEKLRPGETPKSEQSRIERDISLFYE